MTRSEPDLDAEIDALFQLPLAEFTGARNALAKRLKKEGRAFDAERVKALAKPSVPAWAVNQLHWRDRKAIERLLALGERARRAQTGRLKNVDLRELIEEKKMMTAALLKQAAAILEADGQAASGDSLRRVSTTLESLAAWGDMDGAPRAGRLTDDLEPPGFDSLAALMTGKHLAAVKVLPFRPAKPVEDPARIAMRARLEEAVRAAETALREARREAESAESKLTSASSRVAAVDEQRQKLEKQRHDLEKQRQETEALLSEAEEAFELASREARQAAKAIADAERSLENAKGALDK